MSDSSCISSWLTEIGFDGDIPENLSNICNPSTFFIWEQIISKVKSKKEVDKVRKTILVNRLNEKSLEEQQQCLYPLPQIVNYCKKIKQNENIELLEKTIIEKDTVIEEIQKNNKKTYIAIANIKERVQENEDKANILSEKLLLLNDNVKESTEILATLKHHTPEEKQTNETEINETLHSCAQKLKIIADNIKAKNVLNASSQLDDFAFLTPNYPKNQPKSARLMVPGTHKRLDFTPNNKENIDGNTPMARKPKRESLGLLPPSCLAEMDETTDGDFLTVVPRKNAVKTAIFPDVEEQPDLMQRLLKNQPVNASCADLLAANNRFQVFKWFERSTHKILTEMQENIVEFNGLAAGSCTIDEDDLAQLYFLHVKTHLEKLKCQQKSKSLERCLKDKREAILSDKSMLTNEISQLLDLKIEEIELDASMNFLKREICAESNPNHEGECLSQQIKKTQREINSMVDKIEAYNESILILFDAIGERKEESKFSVQRISNFVQDISWANLLKENVFTNEMTIFEHFPLEFHQLSKTNCNKFPSSTTIPASIKLNSDELEMLAAIFDSPSCPPEEILLDIFQNKMKLKQLQELSSIEFTTQLPEYSFSELETDEQMVVKKQMDECDKILQSNATNQVKHAPEKMEKNMKVWLEMPLRHYIPDDKLVDGHNYKYYERRLNN